MMEEVGAMTLRDFSRFKVDALKDFLRKRGLKVSGKRKEELAAIAYGASQAGRGTRTGGQDFLPL